MKVGDNEYFATNDFTSPTPWERESRHPRPGEREAHRAEQLARPFVARVCKLGRSWLLSGDTEGSVLEQFYFYRTSGPNGPLGSLEWLRKG